MISVSVQATCSAAPLSPTTSPVSRSPVKSVRFLIPAPLSHSSLIKRERDMEVVHSQRINPGDRKICNPMKKSKRF